jgi:hypothetical protein
LTLETGGSLDRNPAQYGIRQPIEPACKPVASNEINSKTDGGMRRHFQADELGRGDQEDCPKTAGADRQRAFQKAFEDERQFTVAAQHGHRQEARKCPVTSVHCPRGGRVKGLGNDTVERAAIIEHARHEIGRETPRRLSLRLLGRSGIRHRASPELSAGFMAAYMLRPPPPQPQGPLGS